MRKTTKSYSSVIVISSLLLFLSGCGKAVSFSTAVAVLSATTADKPAESATGIALEQTNGYEAGLKAVSVDFSPNNVDERIPQSDIQRTIRFRMNPHCASFCFSGNNFITISQADIVKYYGGNGFCDKGFGMDGADG